MKLLLNAVTKYLAGAVLVGLLLFLPAGTVHYPGAWRFMALLFLPMLALGAVLFLKAPELLAKRLNTKEKHSAQKGVVGFSALMFVGGFVLAGLDHRFSWSHVPGWVSALSCLLLLLSYGLYAEVMRENAFLSRTIEVQQGQKVVDTGLYAVVRHPMYAVTTLLFLSIPLALGSWWALALFALYPAALVVRIRDEEKLLLRELEGYEAYTKKVRCRLIPYIW